MHLKALKIYCDVVRNRSFSRAAAENAVSQPAASQMVHHLEEKLGVQLIDRSHRPWVLTQEGDVFYRGCRKVVRQLSTLVDAVQSLQDEVAGRVRIACIYSVGLSHINQHVKDFMGHYPKANVQVRYQHPAQIYDSVEKDDVDLGLTSYAKSTRTIRAVPWREEPMVFACAPQHPLAGQSALTLEQLQGLPMVTFDRDLKIRREIDRVLARHDVDVPHVMAFDNTETIKRAVEIDAGFGLLPEPTIMREVQLESLVAIPVVDPETGKPALTRPLSIVYRRGAPLSMTTQRFVRQLKEVCQEGDGARAPWAAHGPPQPRCGHEVSHVVASDRKRFLPPATSEVPELS